MDFPNTHLSNPSVTNSFSFKKNARFMKIARFAGIVIIALIIIVGGVKLLSRKGSSGAQTQEVKGALAVQDINREFTFPLKDGKGQEIGSIKYLVQTAEKRSDIIVKGQKASATTGRTFIILTLKVTNDFKQAIQINTRDYVRLSLNGNEQELLAPDIHNDPVEVQAISTKFTRVGFPVNTTDKSLTLWVGEINSENKDKIELTLQ